MTTEELLKERFEVVADYPFSPFKVCEIVSVGEYNGMVVTGGLDKYPNLFKPLQWWEKREASDMPEYVKCGEKVCKVEYWKRQSPAWDFKIVGSDNILYTAGDIFLPSTLAEYTAYTASKK